jgi:hypothetical protein
MTGNHLLDIFIAIQGALYAISTLVGLIAPKGSKIGILAAKIGSDVKGQTKGHDPNALKNLLETAWEESKDLPVKQIPYAVLHYLGGVANLTPEEMVSYAEKMGVDNGMSDAP